MVVEVIYRAFVISFYPVNRRIVEWRLHDGRRYPAVPSTYEVPHFVGCNHGGDGL